MATATEEEQPNPQGLPFSILSSVAYKTVAAPYSRLQLILQNQTYLRHIGLLPESLLNINSTQISLGTLTYYIYQHEGFLSFWRGHTISILKSVASSLLDHFVKPYIGNNLLLSISPHSAHNSDENSGDDTHQNYENTNNNSSNENDSFLGTRGVTMERTRSLDDPSLANTEVPALIDMIQRHQSHMNETTNVSVAPNALVPSKVISNTANSASHVHTSNTNENGTKNVSMLEKFGKIARRHLIREIYPILSLILLYPLNVFQTYYWLDLRNSANDGNNSDNSNNSKNSSESNQLSLVSGSYAFDKGYYQCYKSLGGTVDVLYSGIISSVIATVMYRQTYFNMHRIIDTLLEKTIGKPLEPPQQQQSAPYSVSRGNNGDGKKEEENKEEQLFKMLNSALRGIITTNIAMFVAFPFHVIKYRMILHRHPNSMVKYKGYKDCIQYTIANEGYNAFFYGATANLVLGLIASIALVTIDVTKRAIMESKRKQQRKTYHGAYRMRQ